MAKRIPVNSNKQTQPKALVDLFTDYSLKEDKGYITQEFQDFGYRLAVDLEDLAHKSLYIRLAKKEPRALLERARNFVIDAQAKNKGALFMWKLAQLRQESKKSLANKYQESRLASIKKS